MNSAEERWREDIALDYYNSLSPERREIFKIAYQRRMRERRAAGDIPVWERNDGGDADADQ